MLRRPLIKGFELPLIFPSGNLDFVLDDPAGMICWVKSRHVQYKRACPLCPRKRRQMRRRGMSAKGQHVAIVLLS